MDPFILKGMSYKTLLQTGSDQDQDDMRNSNAPAHLIDASHYVVDTTCHKSDRDGVQRPLPPNSERYAAASI